MDPATDAKPLPSRPNLEQYKKQAKDLLDACRFGDPDAIRRITECPRVRALSTAVIQPIKYALADAQFVIAREHGFESWPRFSQHLQELVDGPVRQFELAADAVVTGDMPALESLLRANPGLVRARSARVHRATLLHYVAANGVEGFRQQSPRNAVIVARALLNAGAEVDAMADMYGGNSTTMDMLVSSVHPARAGVQVALVETLLEYGAAINGFDNNGSPLLSALAFHYPDAADTLTRLGARVDTIVAAAGLGRADLVGQFIDDDGRLKPDVPLAAVRWPRVQKDPRAHLELALIWAAGFGRTGVVDLLLRKGADLGGKDNQGFTALHSAAFYGHLETVELLLLRHAPLEAENVYGGTVLSSTIWASVHAGLDIDYVPIVQRLIAAGARIDAVEFPSGNRSIDDVLKRHGAHE